MNKAVAPPKRLVAVKHVVHRPSSQGAPCGLRVRGLHFVKREGFEPTLSPRNSHIIFLM
jgi:hypothetical protein